MAREMGSPRLVLNRRRRTREGPEPACVQNTFARRWHTQGREGRVNVLPWYRPVGVAKNLRLEARRKDLTKIRQNLRVFWKPMKPPDCVWEIRYRIIMKTILQEKVRIHCTITIWFTNLFLFLKQ